MTVAAADAPIVPRAHIAVLLVLGATHFLNDLIQALIPAIYPIIKESYALDFARIGFITLTFQIAGSLFQPLVGHYTDKHPMPYSTIIGMVFSFLGVVCLALSNSYPLILTSVALIGIGSSIYHPEATRMARYASANSQGLAQGIFQVGGQMGSAVAPLLAAFIIVRNGQTSVAWFALLALLGMILMGSIVRRNITIREQFLAASADKAKSATGQPTYSPTVVWAGLIVLSVLMFSKVAYLESFRSFYTFYLIDRFGVSIEASQLMLFLLIMSAAVGVIIGGMIGDRIGRYAILWLSILGPLPFALALPYVDLFWTGVLTVAINVLMGSAFAAIMIYAMELVPHRIGLIGGLFYGLNFAMGGIAAAIIGGLSDHIGIEAAYKVCSFLPLAGLLTAFLPRIGDRRPQPTQPGAKAPA
jgi:FSR family fosmidomycin resistance protein-like MFS transporter